MGVLLLVRKLRKSEEFMLDNNRLSLDKTVDVLKAAGFTADELHGDAADPGAHGDVLAVTTPSIQEWTKGYESAFNPKVVGEIAETTE